MQYDISQIETTDIPPLLQEIPSPPDVMYLRGTLPPKDHILLTVVGARAVSPYGRDACKKLIEGLKGYPISIVSGLAIGVDSIAHETALTHGLHTIAVPGSGIDDSVIYPSRHKPLAQKILDNGGALLSEFEPTFRATVWSFPQRNRIMAGMSHATLIIEASEKSGTLITARLATDFNRELMCIPHPIFAEHGKGPHLFLRLGATLIRNSDDILEALHIEKRTTNTAPKPELSILEEKIYTLIIDGMDTDTLTRTLSIPLQEISSTLMIMELRNIICQRLGLWYRA